MTARRLLAVVGTAGVVAGGGLLAVPGLAPAGFGTVLPVLAVAGAALLAAGLAATTGLAAGTDAVAARRAPTGHRVPGDEFDDALAAVSVAGRRDPGEHRDAVSERLEAAAVALLVERRELSPATARRRLSTGAWTDDPLAAAFFAEDAPELSTVDHLRLLAGGEPPFRRRARRAVAAMDALADEGTTAGVDDREGAEAGAGGEGAEAGTDGEGASTGTDGDAGADGEGAEAGTDGDAGTGGEGAEAGTDGDAGADDEGAEAGTDGDAGTGGEDAPGARGTAGEVPR